MAEEVLWGWLPLLLFPVFTENWRAVFQEAAPGLRLLSSPPKPTCVPSACFLPTGSCLVCRSSLLTPSHPTSASTVAPSSLFLSSSGRETLPNQKQLHQAVNSTLMSNNKALLCAPHPITCVAVRPLHPTLAHTCLQHNPGR